MDQLRTALVWLKQQHFWVLCGLVVLIALGAWWTASGKLKKIYAANQTTITNEFKSVQNLRSDPFHPNDDVNAKQEAETKTQAQSVEVIWKQVYNRQREHVLKWPVPPLSKEFGDHVEKLQFGADIPRHLRSNYQNYIDGHFPELPKHIEARIADAVAGVGPGGGMRPGGAEMPGAFPGANEQLADENDYVCEWLAADQAIVRDDLRFPDQPSSLRIWWTQENLWVYETLLDVIARTNRAAGATRTSNAAVKTIGELAVGRRAAGYSRTPGRLAVQPPAPAAGGEPGQPGGVGPVSPEGPGGPGGVPGGREFSPERSMGPGGGEMTEEEERAFLLSGRYLDAQGKPIPFGAGAAPPTDGAPPPDPAAGAGAGGPLDLTVFGQEYKRLPVRMVLEMDQRWLPHLISECASQPLQVEVQEVRINPPDLGGTMSGSGPGGGMGMGMRGGPGGGGSSANIFPEEPPQQPFPTHPEIVNVVIQGTIYIFNKPNPAILQPPGDQPAGDQPAVATTNN